MPSMKRSTVLLITAILICLFLGRRWLLAHREKLATPAPIQMRQILPEKNPPSPDEQILRLFEYAEAHEYGGYLRPDLPGAIEIDKEVLQIDPRSVSAMTAISGLYGKMGKFNLEIKWARKAIAVAPTFYYAYTNCGIALVSSGRYLEARRTFQKATELDPGNPVGFYGLGWLAEKQGNPEKALFFFRKSISLDPRFEHAYYDSAAIYIRLKKYDKAPAALRKQLELDPGQKDALALLRIAKKRKRCMNTSTCQS